MIPGSRALLALDEPSLGAVRARLIQERLTAPGAGSRALPQVVATGKTGSGKSTLGNLLVGVSDLLASTGQQDCTDTVSIVRFPQGLTYVDLPGIASDDLLENYNREALGLPQNAEWPRAEQVRVIEYEERGLQGEQTHRAGQLPPGLIVPDLILYLVAPQQHLARPEEPYVKDLLRRFGTERIVFVLNLFHQRKGERLATRQNIEDVRSRLERWHRDAGTVFDPSRVAAVDCRTGLGLDELLAVAQKALGGDSALAEVIAYQTERALGLYRTLVQEAVLRYAAAAALIVPADDRTAEDELAAAARRLLEYARTLAGGPPLRGKPQLRAFHELIRQVVSEVRRETTEPVIEERSREIFEDVPEYDWVEETDYSRPVYQTRSRKVSAAPGDLDGVVQGIGNWLNGKGFVTHRWVSGPEIVSYEKIVRKVISGYRQVHVRTERWNETVGERIVNVSYDPLGERGVALVLAAWHAALLAATAARQQDLSAAYQAIRAEVKTCGTEPDLLVRHAADVLPRHSDRLLRSILRDGGAGPGARV